MNCLIIELTVLASPKGHVATMKRLKILKIYKNQENNLEDHSNIWGLLRVIMVLVLYIYKLEIKKGT